MLSIKFEIRKKKFKKAMDFSMIELNDFPIVCRICLGKKEKLISIFTEISNLEGKSYREMLKECASVNVCKKTIHKRNNLYSFHLTFVFLGF